MIYDNKKFSAIQNSFSSTSKLENWQVFGCFVVKMRLFFEKQIVQHCLGPIVKVSKTALWCAAQLAQFKERNFFSRQKIGV